MKTMVEYRTELHAWLDAHHERLAPNYDAPGTLDEQVAQMQRVKSILFEAGWMRYGWPERVGGLGGSPMMRTELGAALAARDLAVHAIDVRVVEEGRAMPIRLAAVTPRPDNPPRPA